MILEIPTTTQNLSSLDNLMAKIIMENNNNMLIELYATMLRQKLKRKKNANKKVFRQKKPVVSGIIMDVLALKPTKLR